MGWGPRVVLGLVSALASLHAGCGGDDSQQQSVDSGAGGSMGNGGKDAGPGLDGKAAGSGGAGQGGQVTDSAVIGAGGALPSATGTGGALLGTGGGLPEAGSGGAPPGTGGAPIAAGGGPVGAGGSGPDGGTGGAAEAGVGGSGPGAGGGSGGGIDSGAGGASLDGGPPEASPDVASGPSITTTELLGARTAACNRCIAANCSDSSKPRCETLSGADVGKCLAVLICELGRASAGDTTKPQSCAYNGSALDCYCGLPNDNCPSTGPQLTPGPNITVAVCVPEVVAGFPSAFGYQEIAANYYELQYPSGVANNFTQCVANYCYSDCLP